MDLFDVLRDRRILPISLDIQKLVRDGRQPFDAPLDVELLVASRQRVRANLNNSDGCAQFVRCVDEKALRFFETGVETIESEIDFPDNPQ
ncbi:hypothetical protein D3C72_1902630 [compost metagenome]